MTTLIRNPESESLSQRREQTLGSTPEAALRLYGHETQSEGGAGVPLSQVPGRIVVVGHGMVGQRFCEEIRARDAFAESRLVIFGDEPAYDRVHLARVLLGAPPEDLELQSPGWYRNHNVAAISADPVVRIDREKSLVVSAGGRVEPYDVLVLALGSQPIVGKVKGNDGRDIRCLRNVRDAEDIRLLGERSRTLGLPVAIVGAGLLGLELADVLLRQGVEVDLYDSQDHPLCRQLEGSAGHVLRTLLERPGLRMHMPERIQGFEELDVGTRLTCESGVLGVYGLVVLAMGVRPRDRLASASGLACDLFGGIDVDDTLRTSDPNIFAIGECARHRGYTFGLVAPGYAMAEVLAERLAGNPRIKFERSVVGARLKFEGLDVSALGDSAATGADVSVFSFHESGKYRRIVTASSRIVGLTVIGTWSEISRAEQALARKEKLSRAQLERFEKGDPVWRGGRLSLLDWPDAATVCTCTGVTAGALRRACAQGANTYEALCEKTGASTVCGTCMPLVESLVRAPSEPVMPVWLVRFSVVAVLLAIAYGVFPQIPFSTTILEIDGDFLWRDPIAKQVTGFALVGLYALGLLMVVKKRLGRFSKVSFEGLRAFHAAIGVLCLFGTLAHTGLRLGAGLDRVLILLVLVSTVLGGLAGAIPRLFSEQSRPMVRGRLNRVHTYVLWPLPVLLVAHVVKVYFF